MSLHAAELSRSPHLMARSRDAYPRRVAVRHAWLVGLSASVALVLMHPTASRAQDPNQIGLLPCLPTLQPLVKIPEFISSNGLLQGMILLKDQQQRLAFRWPPQSAHGAPTSGYRCEPQFVRTFEGLGAGPDVVPGPGSLPDYPDPLPGPTLRARLGDIVQLTFLNQIDPNNFGVNIDRGERGIGTGCDEVPGFYPANSQFGAGPDTFPNCFHGSSTANIHFHGTHTNPNTTGDNVFLQVRPSLRDAATNDPIVTAESIAEPFAEFFKNCAERLKEDVLLEWPKVWGDLPSDWTDEQKQLLLAYDSMVPPAQQIWPPNQKQIDADLWPQYYIGAYPYCFQLPEYTEAVWPPPENPTSHANAGLTTELPMDMGRPLLMGQAPGTHWYHAHKHGSTAINVSNGLTGALIIEGQYDDDLNAAYGENWTRTQPVLVINQLGVRPNAERGPNGRADKGEDFSVNGRLNPLLSMRPGEVQLWRIVNTSSRSGAFFIGFDPAAGFQWKQLAQDGVQFNEANYTSPFNENLSFLMAAGNRVDLLVKAPLSPQAEPYPVLVQHSVATSDLKTAPKVPLMSVQVSGDPLDMPMLAHAPSFPPFLADITDAEIRNSRVITFETKPFGHHTIDGKQFDDTIGQLVRLNKAEEWTVENRTVRPPIDHPFHIHINPFQVVEVFDPNEALVDSNGNPLLGADNKPLLKYVINDRTAVTLPDLQCLLDTTKPETWVDCHNVEQSNQIWWDVFPIPSGRNAGGVVIPGHFKMRSRFVDYPGWYVIHCHILAHEDRGMMTVVEVTPFLPPVSHH